jgi:hypothetical protein
MGPIMRLFATNGRRSAGINSEFEVENRKLDACAVEAIPMGFDDVDNSGTGLRSNVKADNEVLVEFRQVAFALPNVDVGSDINERLGRMADGFAKLLEFKYAVINVVAVINRNVAVDGLGAPDFWRNFDHKSANWWRSGRRSSSGGGVRARARGERRTRAEKRRKIAEVVYSIVIIVVGVRVGVVVMGTGTKRRHGIVIGVRIGIVGTMEERRWRIVVIGIVGIGKKRKRDSSGRRHNRNSGDRERGSFA